MAFMVNYPRCRLLSDEADATIKMSFCGLSLGEDLSTVLQLALLRDFEIRVAVLFLEVSDCFHVLEKREPAL